MTRAHSPPEQAGALARADTSSSSSAHSLICDFHALTPQTLDDKGPITPTTMKPSTLPAVTAVFLRAGLVLGGVIDDGVTELDQLFNSTRDATLLDGLVFLGDEDDESYPRPALEGSSGAPPPLGEKIPGDNFLNLCSGDHSADAARFTRVDILPNPPVRGQKLTVSATGNINAKIDKGTKVQVRLKLGGAQVYKKNWDFCEEIKKVGKRCPIVERQVPKITKTFNVPKNIPHGTYTAYANVIGADGSPITCIQGKVKI